MSSKKTKTKTKAKNNNEYWTILQEDPKFLLRCALTHNWDVMLEFGDLLSTCSCQRGLTVMIVEREWGSVSNVCISCDFFVPDDSSSATTFIMIMIMMIE